MYFFGSVVPATRLKVVSWRISQNASGVFAEFFRWKTAAHIKDRDDDDADLTFVH